MSINLTIILEWLYTLIIKTSKYRGGFKRVELILPDIFCLVGSLARGVSLRFNVVIRFTTFC